MDHRSDLDLQLLRSRLIAVAEESSRTLGRLAFSSVAREAKDFACVVTDAKGRLLAHGPQSVPIFLASLPRTVRAMLNHFPPDALAEGDILITNDPWMGTGHLPDLNLVKPVFHAGQLAAFAASSSHVPDIGGRKGGLDIADIFEEGFQIPPLKLLRKGEVDTTLVALLRRNVRVPDDVIGDLWAQVAALDVAEQRMHALVASLEDGAFCRLVDLLLSSSESAMRDALARIPAGSYAAQARPDGLGRDVVLNLTVRMDDSGCEIDFAGSSEQLVGTGLNSAMAYTEAYSYFGVKTLVAPHLPSNHGTMVPVRVVAPEGSILNHQFPVSGLQRAVLGHHIPPAIIRALSSALADRVFAESSAPGWYLRCTGHLDDGSAFSTVLFCAGGTGASSFGPGENVLSWPSNVSNTPVEAIEGTVPIRVLRRALRDGSGGTGHSKGGDGLDFAFEFIGKRECDITFGIDRLKLGPAGIAGGGDGAAGIVLVNTKPIAGVGRVRLSTGDIVEVRTPGGGGYGVGTDEVQAPGAP